MKDEVMSAVNFLTNMLRVKDNVNTRKLNLHQLEQFHYALRDMLHTHYQEHWFPSNPNKGSGYRCIRINHKMDPIISKAGTECGFPEGVLRERFPNELTMWVDPREVSYRIGENGSICILYDGNNIPYEDRRTPTPSIECSPGLKIPNANDDDYDSESCSPMSISPPTPTYERMSTCKGEFRFSSPDFIMENRNGNFVDYVAS